MRIKNKAAAILKQSEMANRADQDGGEFSTQAQIKISVVETMVTVPILLQNFKLDLLPFVLLANDVIRPDKITALLDMWRIKTNCFNKLLTMHAHVSSTFCQH